MSLSRRRAARINAELEVVVRHGGVDRRGRTQDVTPFGLFVRLDPPMSAGLVVEVEVVVGDGRARGWARVVHALDAADAAALGRQPGNGLEVVAGGDEQLTAALIAVVEQSPQVTAVAAEYTALVADGATRLLERLSNILDHAGFRVFTAATGAEAMAIVNRVRPDVVVAARDLPVLDGFGLLDALGAIPELASVPVIMIGGECSDLDRLAALRRGALDVVPKPFTGLEIILRARRLARVARRDPERVLLRGALESLGLPSLLTMMEIERKTGVLAVTSGETVAWLAFVDGRLLRARASDRRGDSRATLMRVLDWDRGNFELTAGGEDVEPELAESVTHLLLEHARVHDERNGSR